MKFDGVAENKDHELADPKGFGVIEYAYSKMAALAGIDMAECRLFEEGGRRHFMTRRFDRLDDGDKLHMQSLAALGHLDFNSPRTNSYEQAFLTMRQLGLPQSQITQQYRRAVFNIVARNQDDHVKNIAFLMDRSGTWCLSPAFDIAYSYNPSGSWTSQHQMSLGGRRDNFTLEDLIQGGKAAGLSARAVQSILNEVTNAVLNWRQIALDVGVLPEHIEGVERNVRLDLASLS